MRSVKPGRGPSMMSGIMAGIVGLFGVVWTAVVAGSGAPGIFMLFGVIFILAAIAMAVYNLVNATAKNRFSAFDITEDGEEPDPLDRRAPAPERRADSAFCPYCGAKAEGDFRFCSRCGKKLP